MPVLTVISPAKSLDLSPVAIAPTEPAWQGDAVRLAKTMRNLPLKGLKSLMDLSDDLARLNRDRYRAFADAPPPEATRPVRVTATWPMEKIRGWRRARSTRRICAGHRTGCASCRAYTASSARSTRSSPTGWRWAAG